MNKFLANIKNSISNIQFKQFIPAILLAGWFVSIPETSHAITLPWNKYLADFTSEITTTVKYLAVLGIIITAIGLFMGNGGDGMRRFLMIILAICIAAYAGTIVTELMGG